MKDPQRRSLRIGAAVILCAVALRLLINGAVVPAFSAGTLPDGASLLMYLETGRLLPRDSQEEPASESTSEEAGDTTRVAFSPEDLSYVDVRYNGDYRPELESLLTRPLTWDLTSGEPAVLILHTHTTESYTPSQGEDYQESADYRTLDEQYNMLSIGDRVAQILTQGGIGVIHDRQLHDYPSYNGSYADSRQAAETYLAEYPGIQLILDIHRDAAEDGSGQMTTSAQVDGQTSAQLMLVVGTDEGGLTHPGWQDNLSLALKLMVVLEKENPGVCRPLSLRTERFNQDLSPGALLIEVGAAGNSHQEALVAAEALARAILALGSGSVTADSTS